MRIVLKITAGPLAGRVFRFKRHDTFLVGRSKHSHLRLPTSDRTCSRIHFMLEVNPPHCRLVDLGSRNGTQVNDQRVKTAELKHGDKIRAGRNILRVVVQTAAAAKPPDAEAAKVADAPAGQGTAQPLPASMPVPQLLPPGVHLPATDVDSAKAPAGPPYLLPPLPAALPPIASSWRPMSTAPLAPPAPPAAPTPLPPVIVAPAQPLAALPSTETTGGDWPATVPPQTPATAPGGTTDDLDSQGYKLGEKIGEGAMGTVYLAHARDGSLAAVKMIRTTEEVSRADLERFLREAAILRELQHPHIVGFRDMGVHAGRPYFVMEYVAGRDASTLVKEQGPMAPARAVALTCQLLEGLEYAHARRFIYRDIKPSNVLVYQEDGRELLKLADFGLARVYQASKLSGLTMDGHIGGTPYFMAPEQLLNFRNAPPSADQYSAAATLYYLLTGWFVYDMPKDVHLVFAKILSEEPVPIRKRQADIPAALAAVVHRALRQQPETRFAKVGLLRKALESLQY